MDIDFSKIPPTLEQQTVALLTEIRDLLEKQYLFHVNQLPVYDRPKVEKTTVLLKPKKK